MKNLVKTVGLSIIASGMLFASPNNDVSELSRVIDISNSLVMDNNFIKAGVSDDGTFGIGETKKPGFQLDPWGDGNYTAIVGGTSTPDYLTPGSPFEGFSLKFELDGNVTIYRANNNDGGTDIIDSNITIAHIRKDINKTDAVLHSAVVKNGDTPYISMRQLYVLEPDSTNLKIQVYITNMTENKLHNVKYARVLDPDPDVDAGGSYATKNQLGLTVNIDDKNISISPTNIAYAIGTKTGMPVGLYTFDNKYKHNVVISPSWTKDPDIILKGGCDGDGDVNATSCSKGDYTIGLAFNIGDLKPGETKVINLGYLFGTSLKKAVESTVKAKFDKTFVDSLELGWHLVGNSDAILDMSLFDSVDLVWTFNAGRWEWYANDEEYKAVLSESGFKEIKGIKPLSGIWIYKKDVTLLSPMDYADSTGGATGD
jgi:hypothetical protein